MIDAVSVSYRAAADRFQAAAAARDRPASKAALAVMQARAKAMDAELHRPLEVGDEAAAWLLNLGIEPP